jgi:hypothetical protein
MISGTKMDIFVQTLDLMRFRNGAGFRGNNHDMGVAIVLLLLKRHLGHHHQHHDRCYVLDTCIARFCVA